MKVLGFNFSFQVEAGYYNKQYVKIICKEAQRLDGISHGDQDDVVRFRFSQGDVAESQIVPSVVARDVV